MMMAHLFLVKTLELIQVHLMEMVRMLVKVLVKKMMMKVAETMLILTSNSM